MHVVDDDVTAVVHSGQCLIQKRHSLFDKTKVQEDQIELTTSLKYRSQVVELCVRKTVRTEKVTRAVKPLR